MKIHMYIVRNKDSFQNIWSFFEDKGFTKGHIDFRVPQKRRDKHRNKILSLDSSQLETVQERYPICWEIAGTPTHLFIGFGADLRFR
jgi:hypothetical protein